MGLQHNSNFSSLYNQLQDTIIPVTKSGEKANTSLFSSSEEKYKSVVPKFLLEICNLIFKKTP